MARAGGLFINDDIMFNMIGFIRGKTLSIKGQVATILTEGGIGYEITLSLPDVMAITEGKDISLWTYLAVRENALDLYGFINEADKDMFKMLLMVSGIGPKTAITVLNTATRAQIIKSVVEQNPNYLSKMAGVGKKMAEKIALELKGKLYSNETSDNGGHHETDALEALISLGYREREAREALKEVGDLETAEQKIKEALKKLGKK